MKSNQKDEDEYIEINIRSPEEIAARLLITEALTLRLVAEDQWNLGEEELEEGPEEIFYDLSRELRDTGLVQALSQTDKRLLKTKLGKVSSRDFAVLANQTMAADSIAMFCGLIPWRPFWRIADDESHFRLNLDEDTIRSLAPRLNLPTEDDAATFQERAELWTWRLFQEMELRSADEIARVAIRSHIHEVMAEAEQAGVFTLSDGDLVLDGKLVSAIEDEMLVLLSLLATMREKSINWLCGMGSNWDSVPSINA